MDWLIDVLIENAALRCQIADFERGANPLNLETDPDIDPRHPDATVPGGVE